MCFVARYSFYNYLCSVWLKLFTSLARVGDFLCRAGETEMRGESQLLVTEGGGKPKEDAEEESQQLVSPYGDGFESWSQAVASRILLDMLDKLPGIGRGTYLVDEQLADQRDEEFLAFQQCTPGLREVYYSLSAKIEGLHVCREDCLMNSVGEVMIAELFCKLVVNGGGCSHVVLGKPCAPIAGTRKLVQVYVDWGLEDVVRACRLSRTGSAPYA